MRERELGKKRRGDEMTRTAAFAGSPTTTSGRDLTRDAEGKMRSRELTYIEI